MLLSLLVHLLLVLFLPSATAVTAVFLQIAIILQPAEPDQGFAPQWTLDLDSSLLIFLSLIFLSTPSLPYC